MAIARHRGDEPKPKRTRKAEKPSTEMLWQMECKLCPLAEVECKHPKMLPTGSGKPTVLMLGESPGRAEDRKGIHFIGESGQLLRPQIPTDWLKDIRFDNVVRCRPTGTGAVEDTEMECCRPRHIYDVEKTKPTAIFGFGLAPLKWALGQTIITNWRGRRVPIKVGKHLCWYYPIMHPKFVSYGRQDYKINARGRRVPLEDGDVGSEDERMFRFDIQRAFAEVDSGKLPKPVVHSKEDAERGVTWVTGHVEGDLKRVLDHIAWCRQQGVTGLDIETNGLRPYKTGAKMLTIALGTEHRTLAFPLEHRESGWNPEELAVVMEALTELIKDPDVSKAVHNAAFEQEWFGYFVGREIVAAPRWDCSMVQAWLLDERKSKSRKGGGLSLDFLCLLYFGINIKPLSKLNVKDLDNEPLEAVLRYNGIDAKYHAMLFIAQRQRLIAEGLQPAYDLRIEFVATTVLTQLKGVPVDQEEVHYLYEKYSGEMQKWEDEIFSFKKVASFRDSKDQPFNPSSNPHTLRLLRDVYGFDRELEKEPERGSKKVSYTTDEEHLAKIDHPLPKALVKWRKFQKRRSTFVIPLKADEEETVIFPDHMLHPVLNTCFTRTGRLSSEDPNEQNFPKRDEVAREVRRQIRAPKGYIICALDYGQIEARVIAMATKDKAFCDSLWKRFDVHTYWAEEIANAYPERVGGRQMLKDKTAMKNFRTDIKNQWTFPLFFGAQLHAAAYYLDIPEEVLKPLYQDFWDTYQGVKKWQSKIMKGYEETGYVETMTGRRRRGPLTINQAINTPIQGTTADIVLDAMTRICKIAVEEDWNYQPIFNVHDDLTFLFPEKEADQYVERVVSKMLDVPFDFVNVPIQVELSAGPNWCDLEEIGKYESDIWFKEAA